MELESTLTLFGKVEMFVNTDSFALNRNYVYLYINIQIMS